MIILFLTTLYIVLTLFYAKLFWYFIHHWERIPENVQLNQTLGRYLETEEWVPYTTFTVVIPARNESENIAQCLNSVLSQNYASINFEVILIDDFSEDDTYLIASTFLAAHHNLKIIRLQDIVNEPLNSYKKFGITEAVKQSKKEWIITTDADCTHPVDWLLSLHEHLIDNKDCVMLSAPVIISNDGTWFQRFQSFEFSGLNTMGASYLFNHQPTMSNGANLTYKKSVFYDVKGYEGLMHLASGDDELLMHKIAEVHPKGIHFLKDKRAVVTTKPVSTKSDFFSQRKRWVSKSTGYQSDRIKWTLGLTYLFISGIVVVGVLTVFHHYLIGLLAVMLLTKWSVEYQLYRVSLPFYGQERFLKSLIINSMLHIMYVTIIGIYGNFGKYSWKGRRVK
jgi:cellulose synthase/poly-beta-1,6-N-acetylglucosamine synthase-like glycosyltransferase